MKTTRTGSRRGFSMVELLVVIAIIAILLSLLFPLVGAARKRADKAVCFSNLGQLGTAFNQYGADNDGRSPDKLVGTMYSWTGKGGRFRAFLFPSRRPLNPYLGSNYDDPDTEVPIARCPRDNGGTLDALQTQYDGVGTSYGANTLTANLNGLEAGSGMVSMRTKPSEYLPGRNDYIGYALSSLRNPSRMIALGEEGAYANVWWSSSRWYNHPPEVYFWHDEPYRWNMLFADGHVEYLRVPFGQTHGNGYTFDNAL